MKNSKTKYATSEQFLSASRKAGIHTDEAPLKYGCVKSTAYNCTSTFMNNNPEVPRYLTGRVYKRFEVLLASESFKHPKDAPNNFISSVKFFKIFPTKCKGNVILPKKSVMKNFKWEGLHPEDQVLEE